MRMKETSKYSPTVSLIVILEIYPNKYHPNKIVMENGLIFL